MENTKILGVCMGNVYTDNYPKALEFYCGVLGLEKTFETGDNACYLKINNSDGLYIEGGFETVEPWPRSSRSTFTFQVGSSSMYDKLKNKGIELLQNEPVMMAKNTYWFQCLDPVGNTVEFIGDE